MLEIGSGCSPLRVPAAEEREGERGKLTATINHCEVDSYCFRKVQTKQTIQFSICYTLNQGIFFCVICYKLFLGKCLANIPSFLWRWLSVALSVVLPSDLNGFIGTKTGTGLYESVFSQPVSGRSPAVLGSIWNSDLFFENVFMHVGSRWESHRSILERVQLIGPMKTITASTSSCFNARETTSI